MGVAFTCGCVFGVWSRSLGPEERTLGLFLRLHTLGLVLYLLVSANSPEDGAAAR